MNEPIHVFKIPRKSGYIPEVDAKVEWQVMVYPDCVEVVMRGGALEPVCLRITGKDLAIDDDWNWGEG